MWHTRAVAWKRAITLAPYGGTRTYDDNRGLSLGAEVPIHACIVYQPVPDLRHTIWRRRPAPWEPGVRSQKPRQVIQCGVIHQNQGKYLLAPRFGVQPRATFQTIGSCEHYTLQWDEGNHRDEAEMAMLGKASE